MPLEPAAHDRRPVSRAIEHHQVLAAVHRTLGATARILDVAELEWGSYNSAFKVVLESNPAVVVRFAPPEGCQLRSERHWLRSEYAVAPFLTCLGSLVPRTLGADFSHELLDRDYLVQSLVEGVPAPERLKDYARALWPGYFRQLGAITKKVHEVSGESWGPAADPLATSWSGAIEQSLLQSIEDLRDLSVEYEDVGQLVTLLDRNRDRLDDVGEPRLLHGDLWTVNVLLQEGAPVPTITGVVDSERAWWGDPLADWSIDRACKRTADEREAFWSGYGHRDQTQATRWRMTMYEARHLVAGRIEAVRLDDPEQINVTIAEMAKRLEVLA